MASQHIFFVSQEGHLCEFTNVPQSDNGWELTNISAALGLSDKKVSASPVGAVLPGGKAVNHLHFAVDGDEASSWEVQRDGGGTGWVKKCEVSLKGRAGDLCFHLSTGGQTHTFYRDTAQHIHEHCNLLTGQKQSDITKSSKGPENVGGDPCCHSETGQQHIFYIDSEGDINELVHKNVVGWSHSNLSKAAKGVSKAVHKPSSFHSASGQHVFFYDAEGSIFDLNFVRSSWGFGGTWTAINLSKATKCSNKVLQGSTLSVHVGPDNSEHLCFRDVNNAINVMSYAGEGCNWVHSCPSDVPKAAGDLHGYSRENDENIAFITEDGHVGLLTWQRGRLIDRRFTKLLCAGCPSAIAHVTPFSLVNTEVHADWKVNTADRAKSTFTTASTSITGAISGVADKVAKLTTEEEGAEPSRLRSSISSVTKQVSNVSDKVSSVASQVKGQVSDATTKATEKVDQYKGQYKEKLSGATAAVTGAIDSVKEKIPGHGGEVEPEGPSPFGLADEAAETDLIFVLVHGNNGNPNDFRMLGEALRRRFGSRALILSSSSNAKDTSVGIEQGGRNLAREITDFLTEHKERIEAKKHKLSIVCHSLGGLFARNALQHLTVTAALNPIVGAVEYESFITLSTPHVGSRRPGGSVSKAVWKTAVHSVVGIAYGQTGKDLMLEGEGGLTPLLVKMSTEEVYLNALKKFKHRTAIGITHNDLSVPFCAASIRNFNPYTKPKAGEGGWRIAGVCGFNEDEMASIQLSAAKHLERALLAEFSSKGTEFNDQTVIPEGGVGPDGKKVYLKDEGAETSMEVETLPEMLRGLQSLKWKRVDVECDYKQTHWPRVHDMTLGKKQPENGPSEEFTEVLVDLLELELTR